jgi:hypothetical protein
MVMLTMLGGYTGRGGLVWADQTPKFFILGYLWEIHPKL